MKRSESEAKGSVCGDFSERSVAHTPLYLRSVRIKPPSCLICCETSKVTCFTIKLRSIACSQNYHRQREIHPFPPLPHLNSSPFTDLLQWLGTDSRENRVSDNWFHQNSCRWSISKKTRLFNMDNINVLNTDGRLTLKWTNQRDEHNIYMLHQIL